jgi:hypothetical protein
VYVRFCVTTDEVLINNLHNLWTIPLRYRHREVWDVSEDTNLREDRFCHLLIVKTGLH